MGRHIYCNGEWVWKYIFAIQSSEQYRIYEELRFGTYDYTYPYCDECDREGNVCGCDYEPYGDCLVLDREEIEKLKDYLDKTGYQKLKKKYENMPNQFEGLEHTKWGPMIRCNSDLDIANYRFAQKNPDFHFYQMIEAFVQFADRDPEEEFFSFDGEF